MVSYLLEFICPVNMALDEVALRKEFDGIRNEGGQCLHLYIYRNLKLQYEEEEESQVDHFNFTSLKRPWRGVNPLGVNRFNVVHLERSWPTKK